MSTTVTPLSSANFISLFTQFLHPNRVAAVARRHRSSPAGAPAKISSFALVAAMVFQVLHSCGLLSDKVHMLFGLSLSDSAISERRQRWGVAFFEALLQRVLHPLARPDTHPKAFYKGLRLVGLDASTWSVSNTPAIKAGTKKDRTRRLRAAFYKIRMATLHELGTHNPLAATLGVKGESEMALAVPLLACLRRGWLLIADRYYGVGCFVARLLALPEGTHFLLRAKANLKSILVKRLPDGSRWVHLRDPALKKDILVREICARVKRRKGPWVSIRLWTNLLDPAAYPATGLVALYGLRWEQEIAFKEMKIHLRRSPLLLGHTLVTAAQEVLCLVLAQAVIARMRLEAADDHTPVLEISFIRTLNCFRALWSVLPFIKDRLLGDSEALLTRRIQQQLADEASCPRRARSCPRALRQPVSKWPRLTKNSNKTGPFKIKIARAAA
ncbi:MAG: IS4 family transposase [Kiritimatiellia bacterium]